ncbi:hypothetical protein FHX44_112491 [Pseudonocardia hierapolitana]|uniref:5-bromo-4-chloroindolyl phosphate hydrolysis protein n=1 Tax=Pseudonocardia hierapolitana TaxID=1128676 RepID=A0A561SP09_9PSEU|nr:hypothetical protein [Pseudonocardia hierapolitana]TWF76598.1 hypothetical protein FHX44_112491 [Pseudonocardia hierapolitana]
MSDRVRRYLGSRKNIAGMAGALAGVGLHLAGVIGDVWPVVAAGLYGVGALVGPSDPPGEPAEPRLTDALRAEAAAILGRAEARSGALPEGAVADVGRIICALRLVLDRLDDVADQETDRIAAPERLADVAEIVRVELPECLETYLGRAPSPPEAPAARELRAQLTLVGERVDRLVAQVPDVHVRRAEDLTREMRRRHERP